MLDLWFGLDATGFHTASKYSDFYVFPLTFLILVVASSIPPHLWAGPYGHLCNAQQYTFTYWYVIVSFFLACLTIYLYLRSFGLGKYLCPPIEGNFHSLCG